MEERHRVVYVLLQSRAQSQTRAGHHGYYEPAYGIETIDEVPIWTTASFMKDTGRPCTNGGRRQSPALLQPRPRHAAVQPPQPLFPTVLEWANRCRYGY